MRLPDYFIQVARYHAWATHKLFADDLARLSDDEWHRDLRLFFGSVHRTVNHLLVADTIWFARFAENTSLRIALNAKRLDGDLVYTRTDGEAARIPYAPALGHVFNHATHHRGQLTAGVTAMGHTGPSLDWAHLLQIEAKQLR